MMLGGFVLENLEQSERKQKDEDPGESTTKVCDLRRAWRILEPLTSTQRGLNGTEDAHHRCLARAVQPTLLGEVPQPLNLASQQIGCRAQLSARRGVLLVAQKGCVDLAVEMS